MATAHRSACAEIDLIGIWGFIANDDSLAADRQLDRIDDACKMLAENPHGGPSREDLARGLRFYLSETTSSSTRSQTMESLWRACFTAHVTIGASSHES